MKKTGILLLLTLVTASASAWADPPWPKKPPQIGHLYLKQEYWEYIKEAAERYDISPYLIQAVSAIESRFDPEATSGKGNCIGLMQLHKDTAKIYGVDPHDPRENIMGGAAVLAKFLDRYDGDIRKTLRKYNATSTPAYEREVLRAFQQAKRRQTPAALSANKSKN